MCCCCVLEPISHAKDDSAVHSAAELNTCKLRYDRGIAQCQLGCLLCILAATIFSENPSVNPTFPQTFFLAGLGSGTTEAILVNPFEVVKVAQQANRLVNRISSLYIHTEEGRCQT